MKTHFSMVPVEIARQKSPKDGVEHFRPLVLIVDDEPIIAETLAAILNGSGLAAVTAPDACAALEIAALMPPEMLITDVAMPGMNGLDLAIEVSRTIQDCEIILFSGQASAWEMEARLREGGHDFVTIIKPVHPADLLARVFERLSRKGCVVPSVPLECRPRPDVFPLPGSYADSSQAAHITIRQRTRPQPPIA